MGNKFAENWQEYNKSALEAAKELEIINTKIIEKLTTKQLELANMAFETGTESVYAVAALKGPQDLVAAQAKLSSEFNEQLIESARTTANIISESREAYKGWLDKSMATITANAETFMPNFAAAQASAKKTA